MKKNQRFFAIIMFNRFVKFTLHSRQKLTLKTFPLKLSMIETVASSVGDFPRPHPLTSLALDAVTLSIEVEWVKYPCAHASMCLSGLEKQHVLFCSMASMKVVWINKEWIALMFVVYCPAHSLFRQRGWRRWCPKIPVEHSKLVTETSLYLLHRSHFWKIISVELDQLNMGKFRT